MIAGNTRAKSAETAKPSAEVYSRLVTDPNIPHGAFRMWHLLRSKYANAEGWAWPGQRRIAKDIHCDVHSLKEWTDSLVGGGYLQAEEFDRGKHPFVTGKVEGFVYQVKDGLGWVLRKTTSPCCEKPHHPVAETRVGGVAGIPMRGVAETRNETNPIEPIPLNQVFTGDQKRGGVSAGAGAESGTGAVGRYPPSLSWCLGSWMSGENKEDPGFKCTEEEARGAFAYLEEKGWDKVPDPRVALKNQVCTRRQLLGRNAEPKEKVNERNKDMYQR